MSILFIAISILTFVVADLKKSDIAHLPENPQSKEFYARTARANIESSTTPNVNVLHRDFVKELRAPPTLPHELIFVVIRKNMNELTRILHDISDPTSPNYGNHLTRQDIFELTSNSVSCEEVAAHLVDAGATVVSKDISLGLITARGSIDLWERMLRAEFFLFSLRRRPHDDVGANNGPHTDEKFMRAEEYFVPTNLHGHVASILNILDMPHTKSRWMPQPSTKTNGISQRQLFTYEGSVTPTLLNKAYNIDDNSGHPRATQAVFNAPGDVFSPGDLFTFQSMIQVENSPLNRTIGVVSTVRTPTFCVNQGYDVCTKSNTIVEYITSIAATPTWRVSLDDDNIGAWLAPFLDEPPLVISINHNVPEYRVSPSQRDLFNEHALILGTMGVTILVQSGDSGVVGDVQYPEECSYNPLFPASSPYVTTIGATQVF